MENVLLKKSNQHNREAGLTIVAASRGSGYEVH